jgi:hypothetical protein
MKLSGMLKVIKSWANGCVERHLTATLESQLQLQVATMVLQFAPTSMGNISTRDHSTEPTQWYRHVDDACGTIPWGR